MPSARLVLIAKEPRAILQLPPRVPALALTKLSDATVMCPGMGFLYTYRVVSTNPVDGAAELVGLVETAIAIPVEKAIPFGNDTLEPAPAGIPFW